MEFKQPHKIYTAASNIEAHQIVEILQAHDIEAYADEDQSGVSLWSFGTFSQFHQPNVWIDKSTAEQARLLVDQFEAKKRTRDKPVTHQGDIEVECEECGKISRFPDGLNGSTQECSHCQAYVDVGELDWDDDFGEPED
jgi:hypothetical protein